MFFEELVANTSINATYEIFEDTAWFERLSLNAFQFSCTKDIANTKLLQQLAFETSNFKEFRDKAHELMDISNDVHLRVEVDSLKRGAVMGESFKSMKKDSDLYRYWVYHGRLDGREREWHVALEGRIFRFGDPQGDKCFPPGDFNCRCWGDNVNDAYLKENNKTVTKGSDILEAKDENGKYYVDPQFRFSPENQVLPNTGGYFQLFNNINKLNADSFDL
jgi:hypothetical protein